MLQCPMPLFQLFPPLCYGVLTAMDCDVAAGAPADFMQTTDYKKCRGLKPTVGFPS